MSETDDLTFVADEPTTHFANIDESIGTDDLTSVALEQTTHFANVNEFVREYLRHVYYSPVDGKTVLWAADWWRYSEAVSRLEAMWRAWEYLRLDPDTGISVWYRDHADPHMRALMSPRGPFAATSPDDTLPYSPPPAGMFDNEPPPLTPDK